MEPVLSTKSALRLLLFLKDARAAQVSSFSQSGEDRRVLTAQQGASSQAGSQKRLLCDVRTLDALIQAGAVVVEKGGVALTTAGKMRLKRLTSSEDGFQEQHRSMTKSSIKVAGALHSVDLNEDESPLSRLRRRKRPDGSLWIDDAAYAAGERLRSDFTRGNLMQTVTSRWEANAGISRKNDGAGGLADLSNAALDARSRLYSALESVGPDLAGVLTDVVCYLKGLERVERERRWPPRSAKLMLRIGLQILARHYGTGALSNTAKMRHWGSAGYRPALSPETE